MTAHCPTSNTVSTALTAATTPASLEDEDEMPDEESRVFEQPEERDSRAMVTGMEDANGTWKSPRQTARENRRASDSGREMLTLATVRLLVMDDLKER